MSKRVFNLVIYTRINVNTKMYTNKKHTSNTCARQRANPDQSGSSLNLQHNYYTSNK